MANLRAPISVGRRTFVQPCARLPRNLILLLGAHRRHGDHDLVGLADAPGETMPEVIVPAVLIERRIRYPDMLLRFRLLHDRGLHLEVLLQDEVEDLVANGLRIRGCMEETLHWLALSAHFPMKVQ